MFTKGYRIKGTTGLLGEVIERVDNLDELSDKKLEVLESLVTLEVIDEYICEDCGRIYDDYEPSVCDCEVESMIYVD